MVETGTLDRLRAIPILAQLDDAGLERVAELATEFEAPAKHVLIEAGQEGSGVFVIEEGTVTVEVPGGPSVSLGPGEYVGELAILVPGILRTARVQAATPIRALAISREDLRTLLDEHPRIGVAMLPVLAGRLAALETGG
ncbi:MAG TPA: cyclic nucleotide-binding domain-containing protein [Actinomycetota bacterium]|jgi:CRP-like cAMP-binding protein